MNRASFFRRLGAAAIDMIAIWLLAAGTQKIAELAVGTQPLRQTRLQSIETWLMLVVVPPLVVVAYTSAEMFYAATLGKKIMKLRIADAEGRRASQGRLLRRWSLKNVALLADIAWTLVFSAVALHGQGVPNWLGTLAPIAMAVITTLLALTALSFLLAARTNRLSFYDWLTGTSVYNAAAITDQPAFEPVMSNNT